MQPGEPGPELPSVQDMEAPGHQLIENYEIVRQQVNIHGNATFHRIVPACPSGCHPLAQAISRLADAIFALCVVILAVVSLWWNTRDARSPWKGRDVLNR